MYGDWEWVEGSRNRCGVVCDWEWVPGVEGCEIIIMNIIPVALIVWGGGGVRSLTAQIGALTVS